MKKHLQLILSLLPLLAPQPLFAADNLREQVRGFFQPIPETPPALPGETATPEKLALGKMLYFDPRLSENQDISCHRCHNIGMGGVDGRSSSIGHIGGLGGRKVLTVLNAVFNKSQFWDGRAADLEEQVVASVMANPGALLRTRGGPTITNPGEITLTKQHAVERLKAIPGYADAFKRAFPNETDPITYENVGRAIAVFEATLITPDAPFDRWLKGDEAALSGEQKQGLRIFVEKGCSNCHNGINIGGGTYTRFGSVQNPGPEFLPPDDWGRFAVTKDLNDKYVFKVPGLRNVELTAPYFHSGQSWDLKEAISVMGQSELGQKLSADETEKLTEFLKSLTGRQPQIVLPILPPSQPTAPHPQ